MTETLIAVLRTLKKSLSGRPTSVGKTDQQPLFCDKRPQHSSLCGRCDRWCALFAGALTSKRPLLSHALAVRRRGPCAHRPSAIGRCQDNSPPHCCLRGIKSGCSGHGFFVSPTYPVGPRPRADFFLLYSLCSPFARYPRPPCLTVKIPSIALRLGVPSTMDTSPSTPIFLSCSQPHADPFPAAHRCMRTRQKKTSYSRLAPYHARRT